MQPPSPEKSHPLVPSNPPLKIEVLSSPPLFQNLVRGSTNPHPPPPKWLVDFNAGKTQLVSLNWSNNNGSIDVKMDESVLEKKSSFKMLVLTSSKALDTC